jgi:hypothetical protein
MWTVEEYAVAGRDVPMLTDPKRWRLVRFQLPGLLNAELADGSWKTHPFELKPGGKSLRIEQPEIRAAFSLEQPDEDVLVLNGAMNGQPVTMKLRKAPLTRGDFDWISDRSVQSSLTRPDD